ncbi:glutathione S-transferase family protein [Roseibium sp. RKSG952]|uniref:glutathione S-transferase family protein n=1 Tax=Roseibium sp. RKSG952 TaxID=2529384 RepID=UPI0012BD2BC6|nr:glutathione S-transferase family protein [Roseibium sp. RKSG952]MTI01065.1 glutathione S-transferase family protein [Roseibium sp. RKSG952]
MYEVIGFAKTRAMRVMWILEELGAPYKVTPVMPQSPEAREVNPSGKVPILRDGDNLLTDSVAICTYLADKSGKFTYPAGTFERARQDSMTQFVVDELETPLWMAAKHSFVLPEKLRVPDVKETCQAEFARGLKHLEKRLGDNEYLAGAQFTIADIIAGHCGSWAANAKFDLPKEGPVYDYFKRLRQRPAYLAMIERIAEPA